MHARMSIVLVGSYWCNWVPSIPQDRGERG